MTIKNIQRDGVFMAPRDQHIITWSTQAGILANGQVNALDTIFYDYAHVQADYRANHSCSSGNYTAVGIYIQQPVNDRMPYRVKCSVLSPLGGQDKGMLMVGYQQPPAAQTLPELFATDAVVLQPNYIPFTGQLDELIIVNPLDAQDINYGRPLCFAVCLTPQSDITNSPSIGHISVQNLGVKPPTMFNAVS